MSISIKNMEPDQIKDALRAVGITPSGIARDLNVSATQVYRVINGGSVSDPVRKHIALCINIPVETIWPETYLVKEDPTKKGRPLSRGLFDTQRHAA